MTIYASGAFTHATYFRKSNKHNWILGLSATNKAEFVRAVYLNQKDYPLFQHGYINLDPSIGEYDLDNLPKNANVIPIRVNLVDPIMVKALENFFNNGITPINPAVFVGFVELGLLKSKYHNDLFEE